MENIQTFLSSTFTGLHCLLSTNYTGQQFIRIIPVVSRDELLQYYPLVEIRCVQEEDIIKIVLVNYRMELLDISLSVNLADIEKICDFVRQYLLGTQFVRCKGLQRVDVSDKSKVLSERGTNGRKSFRSIECKTVYVKDEENIEGFLCDSCTKLKRVTRRVEEPIQQEEPELPDVEEEVLRVCPFEDCKRSFRRKTPYENHLKLHKTIAKPTRRKKRKKKKVKAVEDKEYQCPKCQQSYNYEKSYIKHLRTHDIYICTKCPEEFPSNEELSEHYQSSHPKVERKKKYNIDREIDCELCEEHFDNLEALSKHNIEHHDIAGDPCPICGKHLQKSSMRNHIEKVHNADTARKYTCQDCGKVYKTKTDLDTHYTKHSGEKMYTCQVCGKSYRFWNGLDNCLRKHEQRDRYHCDWEGCGKSFNSKFRLDNHTRSHDGVKPFNCPLCPYNCSR